MLFVFQRRSVLLLDVESTVEQLSDCSIHRLATLSSSHACTKIATQIRLGPTLL